MFTVCSFDLKNKEIIMTERKTYNPKATEIKKDHIMAFIYYAKVKEVASNGELLHLENLRDGSEFRVSGLALVEDSCSADQYHEEVKVSKTKAAEILIESHNRPFTVSFQKQDGEERVLRGRLIRPEPLLGRSMVEDFDQSDTGNRFRQVDHRTINFLIVDGVKYVVQGK